MDTATLIIEKPAVQPENTLHKLEFRAMGSQMLAVLQGDSPAGNNRVAQVPEWFEHWEQILSRFRPSSELSHLNNSPERPVAVSPELWEVLQLALAAARQTNGLVTPAVLNAVEAAGYDRTFAAVLARPSAQPAGLSAPPLVASWHAIRRDPRGRRVTLPRGMRLDFGGVAKGWAADRAVARLARSGPALVDAAGDIAVSGPMIGGAPWPIGVADPTAPGQELELLAIAAGGVATSGRDYHRWRHNGVEVHHIIDPRTGTPAYTDVLSATVIGPGAAQAEVAAKAALILGSRAGLQWLDTRPEFAGLLILDNGRALRSRRFNEYTWK